MVHDYIMPSSKMTVTSFKGIVCTSRHIHNFLISRMNC